MRTFRSHGFFLIAFFACVAGLWAENTPPTHDGAAAAADKKTTTTQRDPFVDKQAELVSTAVSTIGNCGEKKANYDGQNDGTLTYNLKNGLFGLMREYISTHAKSDSQPPAPMDKKALLELFSRKFGAKSWAEVKDTKSKFNKLQDGIEALASMYASGLGKVYEDVKNHKSELTAELLASAETAATEARVGRKGDQRAQDLAFLRAMDRGYIDAVDGADKTTAGKIDKLGTAFNDWMKTCAVASDVPTEDALKDAADKQSKKSTKRQERSLAKEEATAVAKKAEEHVNATEFGAVGTGSEEQLKKVQEAQKRLNDAFPKAEQQASLKKRLADVAKKLGATEEGKTTAPAAAEKEGQAPPNPSDSAIEAEKLQKAKAFLQDVNVKDTFPEIKRLFPDGQEPTDAQIARLLSKSPNPPLNPEERGIAVTIADHLAGKKSNKDLLEAKKNRKKIAEDLLTRAGVALNSSNEQQRRSLADRVDELIEKEKALLVKMRADDPMIDIYGTEVNPDYAQAQARIIALEQYRDQHLVRAKTDQATFESNKTLRLTTIEAANVEVKKLTAIPKDEIPALVSAYVAAKPKTDEATKTVLNGYGSQGPAYFESFQVGRFLIDQKTGSKAQSELAEFRSTYVKSIQLRQRWPELYREALANNSSVYQSLAEVQGGAASQEAPSLESIFRFLLKNPKDPLSQK